MRRSVEYANNTILDVTNNNYTTILWCFSVRVAILANLSRDSGNLANFESIWLQTFWFGEMYDLYICTYLLTYSYAELLFLSLLMLV